jgi:Protein of unknown function (DUF2971)
MWRAFGNNTARVALVINIPAFSKGAEALKLMFSPVAYLTEAEVHAVLNEVAEKIGSHADFLRCIDRHIVVPAVFNILLVGVTCLKHEGFHEEREWRAILSTTETKCAKRRRESVPARLTEKGFEAPFYNGAFVSI